MPSSLVGGNDTKAGVSRPSQGLHALDSRPVIKAFHWSAKEGVFCAVTL
jgi:hypothetical protein